MKKGGKLCREILITAGGSVSLADVIVTVGMTDVTAEMTAEMIDVTTDVTAGMTAETTVAMTGVAAIKRNLEPFRRLLKI